MTGRVPLRLLGAALAALLLPLPALAQLPDLYPGAYSNRTTHFGPNANFDLGSGALTATGGGTLGGNWGGEINLIGSNSSAITSYGQMATFQNSTTSAATIRNGVTGQDTFDEVQTAVVAPSGSTITGINGFATYMENYASGGGANGNTVGYYVMNLCLANNCQTWGMNSIVSDNTSNALSSGTGRKLIGYEGDFTSTSTATTIQGISLTGSSTAQPAGATGFSISDLSSQSPGLALWTYGFTCNNGVANGCMYVGAAAHSGTNIASQPVRFAYFDGSGAGQSYTIYATVAGTLQITGTSTVTLDLQGALTATGGATIQGLSYIGGASGAESLLVPHVANAVNFLQTGGAATGNSPYIATGGSDANIGLSVITTGAGQISFLTHSNAMQVAIQDTPSATNFMVLTGSAGGAPVINTNSGTLSIPPKVYAGNSITATGQIVGYKPVASAVAATAGTTLTAAQMAAGLIARSGPTAAFTDTTDTAANIITAIANMATGEGFEMDLQNTTAYTLTLAAGAGVTLAGTTTIAAGSTRVYRVTMTGAGAVTITGVAQAAN